MICFFHDSRCVVHILLMGLVAMSKKLESAGKYLLTHITDTFKYIITGFTLCSSIYLLALLFIQVYTYEHYYLFKYILMGITIYYTAFSLHRSASHPKYPLHSHYTPMWTLFSYMVIWRRNTVPRYRSRYGGSAQ